MADELRIFAAFDPSPITEGISQAAAAIQQAASQIGPSFEQMEASAKGAEAVLTQLVGEISTISAPAGSLQDALLSAGEASSSLGIQLTSTFAKLQEAGPAIQALEDDLGSVRQQLLYFGEAQLAVAPTTAQLEAAAQSGAASVAMLTGELATVSSASQQAGQSLIQSESGLQATGQAASEASTQISQVGIQQQLFAESGSAVAATAVQVETQLAVAGAAANNLGLEIAVTASNAERLNAVMTEFGITSTAVNDALNSTKGGVEGVGAVFLNSGASITATTVALSALGFSADDVGRAIQALRPTIQSTKVATEDLGQATTRQSYTVAEGVRSSVAMREALALLNNEQIKASGNTALLTDAKKLLDTELKKLKLTLIETETGFQVVTLASIQAANGFGRADQSAAYLGARLLAQMIPGFGQLGFVLGNIARLSTSIGPVIAAAFPIIGVVALIYVVDLVIEKFEKLKDEIRKATNELNDNASAATKHADSIHLQNLKLEDQIRKLESRPSVNYLAISLLEAKMQADDLLKSLRDVNERQIDLIEKSKIGIYKHIITAQERTTPFAEEVKPELALFTEVLAKREQLNQELFRAENQLQIARKNNSQEEISASERVVESVNKRVRIADEEVERTRVNTTKIVRSWEERVAAEEAARIESIKRTRDGVLLPGEEEQIRRQYTTLRTQIITTGTELERAKDSQDAFNLSRELMQEKAKKDESVELTKQQLTVDASAAEARRRIRLAEVTAQEKAIKDLYDLGKITLAKEEEDLKTLAKRKLDIELEYQATKRAIARRAEGEAGAPPRSFEAISKTIFADEQTARIRYHQEIRKIETDAQEERNREVLKAIIAAEKEQLAATQKGTAERITIIKATIDKIIAEYARLTGQQVTPTLVLSKDFKAAIDKQNADLVTAQKDFEETQKQLRVLTERANIAATREGTQKREDAERQYLAVVKQLYGEEGKEYKTALVEIEREHRKFLDRQARMRADELASQEKITLLQLDAEREAWEFRIPTILSTSEEVLRIQEDYARREKDIRIQTLEEQAKLYDPSIFESFEAKKLEIIKRYAGEERDVKLKELEEDQKRHADDPEKLAKIRQKQLEIEQRYENQVAAIRRQGARDQIQLQESVTQSIERGFSSMFQSIFRTWRDFGSAVISLWQGVVAAFGDFLARKLQMWIQEHILEKIWALIFAKQIVQEREAILLAPTGPSGLAGTVPGLGPAAPLPGFIPPVGGTAQVVEAATTEQQITQIKLAELQIRTQAEQLAAQQQAAANLSKTTEAISNETLETTATRASEIQQVSITRGGELAKTSSTAAGAASRTSIGITETGTHTAQQATQAAATAGSQAAQTSETAAGASSRGGIGLVEHLKSIFRHAAVAAAAAFRHVMEVVPFPADVILAPLVAASVFAAVLAYGAIGGKAQGGLVRGSGTATSDSIPTMLSDREYVIKASTVDKLGVGMLDALNSGQLVPTLGGSAGVQLSMSPLPAGPAMIKSTSGVGVGFGSVTTSRLEGGKTIIRHGDKYSVSISAVDAKSFQSLVDSNDQIFMNIFHRGVRQGKIKMGKIV